MWGLNVHAVTMAVLSVDYSSALFVYTPEKILRHCNYCRANSVADQGLLSRLFNDIHTVICFDCLQIGECTARFCLVGIWSCKSHWTWEKAMPSLSFHQEFLDMYLLNVSRWPYLVYNMYLKVFTVLFNSQGRFETLATFKHSST